MKKLIVFLLCFTLLAVGVTYGCIQYTLRGGAGEESAPEIGIDLDGFYDENDLIVIEVREDTDEAFISYPQIDGLKNAEVQTSVNALIRSEAERLKKQDVDAGGVVRYLSYNISSSFANTLSVGLYSAQEQVYLNFNLNDGSLLQLSDLFAADADLQGIVHGAFYDALIRGNPGDGYGSPDENVLYKTVKAYLAQDNKPFLFTPSEINLYYGNYMASVQMMEYADDIVIYSKYLTDESLFAEDGIGGDGMFTCSSLRGGYVQRQFGFAADNFWYDIALPELYVDEAVPTEKAEQFELFCEERYTELVAEVDTLRTRALENPDKAYVLLAKPDAYLYQASQQINGEWQETVSNAAEFNGNYALYEMSADLFERKYRQKLVEMYRANTYSLFYGAMEEYIDENEVQVTKRNSYELYNYVTGNPITLSDLFVSGYDYMDTILRQAKFDMAGYYGYTLELAELALQEAWCELEGSGVRLYLPEWSEEQTLYYALSQFPQNVLTIFG